MIYNNLDLVLKTSDGKVYMLYLGNDNSLIIDKISAGNKIAILARIKSVKDFSADIDEYDRIHIAYVLTNGTLFYLMLENNAMLKSPITLSKDNSDIGYLTLKFSGSLLHILFMAKSKKISNQYELYDFIKSENKLNKIKIADITKTRSLYPFLLDGISGSLYLLYSDNCADNFIVNKFDNATGLWIIYYKNLKIKNAHNINFLIDNQNTGIIIFNCYINNSVQVLEIHKNLNNYNADWSMPKLLSKSGTDSVHPSILCVDTKTYVLWEEKKNIVYKTFDDINSEWESRVFLCKKNESIKRVILISNLISLKDTTCYINSDFSMVQLQNRKNSDIIIASSMTSKSNEFYNNINPQDDVTQKSALRNLQLILIEKDKKISSLKNEIQKLDFDKKVLSQNILHLNESITNLELEISNLKSEKGKSQKKWKLNIFKDQRN